MHFDPLQTKTPQPIGTKIDTIDKVGRPCIHVPNFVKIGSGLRLLMYEGEIDGNTPVNFFSDFICARTAHPRQCTPVY
jgi:hypothetical protein